MTQIFPMPPGRRKKKEDVIGAAISKGKSASSAATSTSEATRKKRLLPGGKHLRKDPQTGVLADPETMELVRKRRQGYQAAEQRTLQRNVFTPGMSRDTVGSNKTIENVYGPSGGTSSLPDVLGISRVDTGKSSPTRPVTPSPQGQQARSNILSQPAGAAPDPMVPDISPGAGKPELGLPGQYLNANPALERRARLKLERAEALARDTGDPSVLREAVGEVNEMIGGAVDLEQKFPEFLNLRETVQGGEQLLPGVQQQRQARQAQAEQQEARAAQRQQQARREAEIDVALDSDTPSDKAKLFNKYGDMAWGEHDKFDEFRQRVDNAGGIQAWLKQANAKQKGRKPKERNIPTFSQQGREAEKWLEGDPKADWEEGENEAIDTNPEASVLGATVTGKGGKKTTGWKRYLQWAKSRDMTKAEAQVAWADQLMRAPGYGPEAVKEFYEKTGKKQAPVIVGEDVPDTAEPTPPSQQEPQQQAQELSPALEEVVSDVYYRRQHDSFDPQNPEHLRTAASVADTHGKPDLAWNLATRAIQSADSKQRATQAFELAGDTAYRAAFDAAEFVEQQTGGDEVRVYSDPEVRRISQAATTWATRAALMRKAAMDAGGGNKSALQNARKLLFDQQRFKNMAREGDDGLANNIGMVAKTAPDSKTALEAGDVLYQAAAIDDPQQRKQALIALMIPEDGEKTVFHKTDDVTVAAYARIIASLLENPAE
jgi:type II secretory pathway pseudopilin PulG